MTGSPTGTAPSARANSFPWPPVLLIAAIAAAWLLGLSMPLDWPGTDDLPARIVGLGLGVVGLILIFAAALALRRHGTTIMPDGTSTALVTSGPYGFFRNPIYLGEVLILLTLAELTKNIWFAAAALAFALTVTVLQIRPEERHLEARFGDVYRDYKRRTRRWI